MAQVAAAQAEQSETDRRIALPIIAKMKETGLHRLVQPAAFGGADRPISALIDAVEIVARKYGSAAWVLAVLAGHSLDVREFSAEAQDDVWGHDPDALACSSYTPVGQVELADGGYRLSGDYPFASGCEHAQWAVLGGMRPQGDPALSSPSPVFRLLAPLADATIIDDWHTLGLRGTGSKTLRFNNIFVPQHRTYTPGSIEGTADPLTLMMAMVGMAQAAVDAFAESLRGKPGTRGRVPPAESELTQMLVGQSYAEVEAAAVLVKDAARRALDHSKTAFPLELRARVRGMSGLIARLATQATDRLQITSGGHGIYDRSAVQRRFCDVHAAAQHVSFNPEMAFRQSGVMRMAPQNYRPMM
ncbi:acyl-CoA dehydrogenase family protein [Sphingobium sp. MK2]|uniref:acyl-CoA dehydrogenase family protein n=1 Tax=Sphingobium sp. MK2 TaxID=3116540 RepID=UPI0032E3586B